MDVQGSVQNHNNMKSAITLFLLLLSFVCWSQYPEGDMINFYGKTTRMNLKDSTEKPLDGVKIEFWSNAELLGEFTTVKKGGYTYNLPFRKSYTVKFIADQYVTKIIEVGIDRFYDEADKRGLKMQIDVALFKDSGFMGLDFMREVPVAKAEYIPRKKTLVWDDKYRKNIQVRMVSVLKAYGY